MSVAVIAFTTFVTMMIRCYASEIYLKKSQKKSQENLEMKEFHLLKERLCSFGITEMLVESKAEA